MDSTHVRCALMRIVRALVLAWLISAIAAAASGQPIVYVDDDAAPGGNGSSWGTAYNDLQDALDAAAVPGSGITEIRVGQGRYLPTYRTEPSDPRSATFQLLDGVALKGGYAGVGAKDPDERDPEVFESILSGDINGDDLPAFVNNSENVYHIMRTAVSGTMNLIEGVVVRGGNSPSGGAGLYSYDGSNISVSSCKFDGNYATGAPAIATLHGVVELVSTTFQDNTATEMAGAVWIDYPTAGHVSGCKFLFNAAGVAAGALRVDGPFLVTGCTFKGNYAALMGGGIYVHKGDIQDCQFIGNISDWIGGGAAVGGDANFVNCVFSRNEADGAGGLFCGLEDTHVHNCSLAGNVGGGIGIFPLDGAQLFVRNSILWGNVPYQIADEQSPPGLVASWYVSNCDIQDGRFGDTNINVDPMFLQPGCDNLRLAFGSPCIDAGNNSYIPPGITTDLDGQARIQNGVVDMGAYEGGHDPLPPTACEDNLDQGWTVKLMPSGGAFNPPTTSAIYIENVSAPDNAWVTVSQIDTPQHAGAGGFNELGSILDVQTSIPDSQFFMRVYIPFTPANLNGFDPLDADLTYFDAQSGNWQLAALANTQNSPGHKGPVGDRIVTVGTSWNNVWTFDLGDYGVFWNPSTQQGFVWANVDHASDFAFGIELPQCSGDCGYPTSGAVNQDDLTAVINAWGITPTGPASFADINHDGLVNAADLLAVLNGWGPCP